MNIHRFYDKAYDFFLKQFLGAFACKMRLIAVAYLSVSVYQDHSHGTEFCEILCLGFYKNLSTNSDFG
jgi:hypothetical protein